MVSTTPISGQSISGLFSGNKVADVDIFATHTKAEHTEVIARFLPSGQLFTSKLLPSKNLYKLLFGLACTAKEVEDNLIATYGEYDFRDTVEFIEEWESAVGIPDDCFNGGGSLDKRRRDINVKWLSQGIQTLDDFVFIAGFFNATVQIRSGSEILGWPITWPLIWQSPKLARFSIYVNITVDDIEAWPYVWPITWGSEAKATLKCLFEKLKPSNVVVIFTDKAFP